MPSGIPNVDLPRVTLTEIYGPASSGKTGTLFAALARAIRLPEYCVLIDASDSFDPASGSEAGINLNQLLWIRCDGNAEHALKATDLVVQAGGFGLVVLDLDGVPVRDARRISLASWFRLRHRAEKTNTALVVVEQELNAGSCSTLQIETRRGDLRFHGALLRGIDGEAKLGPRLRRETQYQLDPVFSTYTATFAARGFRGITVIPPGQERAVLSTTPLNLLPCSPEVAAILNAWGIRTFSEFAALPPAGIAARLGKEGSYLQRLVQGVGNRQVRPLARTTAVRRRVRAGIANRANGIAFVSAGAFAPWSLRPAYCKLVEYRRDPPLSHLWD